MQNPGNQSEKQQKERSTPKIVDAELDFALVISRSLCLAVHLLVFALLFVLLDNAPLIMHGVIWGGQTHNRGYANTYSYLCFTPHLCKFHQSMCRSSSRSIHMCNITSSSICLYLHAGISQFPTELQNLWHEYYSHWLEAYWLNTLARKP